MDLIKLILSSPAGSFGFVVGILGIAFYLTHYITKKITEINASHGELSKRSCTTDSHIDEIRKDISFLKGSLGSIRIDELHKDISFLKGSMAIMQNGAVPPVKSRSPVSLTEQGQQIAIDLGVEGKIETNWEKIKSDLDLNVSSKNAYDIQTYCMETAAVDAERFFDAQTIDKIKMYAFLNGNNLFYYASIFGVLIRDKYLKEKGIDVSQIDKNDPNYKTMSEL